MELPFCINYLLNVAQHEVFQTFSARLEAFGITPGQYGVLNCLWSKGTATPKEIAQELRLENSTISGVLDRMQKRGLIDRIMDPDDRRSIQVVATEAGMAIKDDVLQTVDELNTIVLRVLTPGQKETLLTCLRKIGNVTLPE